MPTNTTPAARLIQVTGSAAPNALPTKTPIPDTAVSAAAAPMKTDSGRPVDAASVTAASCVLSPISARKIADAVVAITRQSTTPPPSATEYRAYRISLIAHRSDRSGDQRFATSDERSG